MCGINGGIFLRGDTTPPTELIASVTSQSKRGPDATGYLERPISTTHSLWLAHNRLSIVDLTDEANQPMVSPNGRYALVFNGMIYNYVELRVELEALGYRFQTSSDTEVLQAAIILWGADALSRLYGMFALALHDSEANTLTLARDRFGVKPLYYRADAGAFRFASTPGAMAHEAGSAPDLEYAGRGIRLKYYDDEQDISPFQGIKALPPGHFAVINLSKGHAVEPKAYYDLEKAVAGRRSAMDLADKRQLRSNLFELLDDAARIRLRADVAIGISLSAGVDSTSVAALCQRQGADITGFCFGNIDDLKSEAPAAKRFADALGQKSVFIPQVPGKPAKSLFWQTLHAQGAPFPHTSQIAQFAVFEAARNAGMKVMLGGQGGDEAFMGYRKFFLFQLRYMLRQREIGAIPAMARNIVQVFPAIASKASLFWRERGRYRANSSEGLGSNLRLPELTRSASPGMGMGTDPALRQMLDITRFSLPSLLRYEDRNSMGNSIESRLPFLDHRVIEYGIALPTAAKLQAGMGKHVLRDAMRGMVPDEILFNRDKRGFDTRHGDWISSGIGEAIREGIAVKGGAAAAYLPAGCIPNDYFSDDGLTNNASRFAEATTLLWLLDPSLKSYPRE